MNYFIFQVSEDNYRIAPHGGGIREAVLFDQFGDHHLYTPGQNPLTPSQSGWSFGWGGSGGSQAIYLAKGRVPSLPAPF